MALHFHNLQAPAAARMQACQTSHLQARAVTRLEWDFSDDFNRGDAGALGAPWTSNGLGIISNRAASAAAETNAYVLASDDGERDFTIEDGVATIEIGCGWAVDTEVRWTLLFGDAAGVNRAYVGVYYDQAGGTWDAYWAVGAGGTNTITSGAGQPPAGTLTLTVVKRKVSGSFNGSTAGGTVAVEDCPSTIRLFLGQDPVNPALDWLDNLACHVEGY